jgi:hypothetical protein
VVKVLKVIELISLTNRNGAEVVEKEQRIE